MKTLTMLGALGENPQQKFKLVTGYARKDDVNVIGIDENGNIDWYNEKSQRFEQTYFRIYGTLDWEWEPYQEPVDFMTAINSGKKIRPVIGTFEAFAYCEPESWLLEFGDEDDGDIYKNRMKYINGLWEIE